MLVDVFWRHSIEVLLESVLDVVGPAFRLELSIALLYLLLLALPFMQQPFISSGGDNLYHLLVDLLVGR